MLPLPVLGVALAMLEPRSYALAFARGAEPCPFSPAPGHVSALTGRDRLTRACR